VEKVKMDVTQLIKGSRMVKPRPSYQSYPAGLTTIRFCKVKPLADFPVPKY
jgi:hypothetical protein